MFVLMCVGLGFACFLVTEMLPGTSAVKSLVPKGFAGVAGFVGHAVFHLPPMETATIFMAVLNSESFSSLVKHALGMRDAIQQLSGDVIFVDKGKQFMGLICVMMGLTGLAALQGCSGTKASLGGLTGSLSAPAPPGTVCKDGFCTTPITSSTLAQLLHRPPKQKIMTPEK